MDIGSMKLIVAGASGFVGRGLLKRLSASGHGGVATGREPPADLPTGWRAARRDDVLSGSMDVAADAVIHLEVKQHVPRPTASDIEAFLRANVAGTQEWLDWAGRHGVRRFIYTSSIKAVAAGDHGAGGEYDTRQSGRDDGRDGGGEGAACRSAPDTPYGRSKALGEAAVCAWAAADPAREVVILRPAPVYGPGNQANLAAFVRQVMAGKPCLIGRGETRKSVVSLENVAAAIEFAAEHAAAGCDLFNVSDRETLSLRQLADTVAELAHSRPPRGINAALAACVAPLGDLLTAVTGLDFPLTTSRLKALRETSVFPCDKLVAAGFSHPQTTRQGLAELIDSMMAQRAQP